MKKDDSSPGLPDDSGIRPIQVNPEREVEWDSNASTLNNDDDDAEERKQWSGGMESPDARKAAKAERKAARNQVLFEVITQEELAVVERVLHPEAENQASAISKGQGLADNRTIDENIAFNPNTVRWSKFRQGFYAEKIAKSNGGKQKPNTPEQDNKILSPIFAQFGISTNMSKANRERKSLDTKIRAAILGDLVAFDNDQVETMQRMAGYWRYANKRVYNSMVRNNELWDWATGEKLPEITEETELDLIEEEAANPEAGTHVEMQGRIPDNWDDPDFDLSAGVAALSLAPLVDGPNNNKAGGSDREPNEIIESTGYHIGTSKLSSSAECLTVQTLSFNVLSSLSSEDTWEQLPAESGDQTKEAPETFNGSSTPRNPLSPMTSNPKGPHEKCFQGVKDTRIFGKAIHKASPPLEDAPPRTRTSQPNRNPSTPATTPKRDDRDPLNRFGALDHEVPAPSAQVNQPVSSTPAAKKSVAARTIPVPTKPIVKTLAIYDEQDKGTTTTRRPLMGRKGGVMNGSPAAAVAALGEEQAAVDNVHAKRFAGGKSFAAVVKGGL